MIPTSAKVALIGTSRFAFRHRYFEYTYWLKPRPCTRHGARVSASPSNRNGNRFVAPKLLGGAFVSGALATQQMSDQLRQPGAETRGGDRSGGWGFSKANVRPKCCFVRIVPKTKVAAWRNSSQNFRLTASHLSAPTGDRYDESKSGCPVAARDSLRGCRVRAGSNQRASQFRHRSCSIARS